MIGNQYVDTPFAAKHRVHQLPLLQVMSIDATLNSEHSSKAVAAGDNLGRIRLLRQPCTSPYADSKSYR